MTYSKVSLKEAGKKERPNAAIVLPILRPHACPNKMRTATLNLQPNASILLPNLPLREPIFHTFDSLVTPHHLVGSR